MDKLSGNLLFSYGHHPQIYIYIYIFIYIYCIIYVYVFEYIYINVDVYKYICVCVCGYAIPILRHYSIEFGHLVAEVIAKNKDDPVS